MQKPRFWFGALITAIVITLPTLSPANGMDDPLDIDKQFEKLDLAAQIGRLYARDQYVRRVAFTIMNRLNGTASEEQVAQISRNVRAVDAENMVEAKEILANYSLGDIAAMENRLLDHFLSIIHHSNDTALKLSLIDQVKIVFESGGMSPYSFAKLNDRFLLEAGKKQLYGTQTECVDGKLTLSDADDLAKVEARRAKLGLDPLEQISPLLNQFCLPFAQTIRQAWDVV